MEAKTFDDAIKVLKAAMNHADSLHDTRKAMEIARGLNLLEIVKADANRDPGEPTDAETWAANERLMKGE